MDQQKWYAEWDNRTLLYTARRLDPNRTVAISADPAFLQGFSGQVAALTAANLVGRITSSVTLAFPDVPLHPMLPWRGQSLRGLILSRMKAANPFGRYCIRDLESEDFQFHLGFQGNGDVVHGSGWNAYVGPGPSPLPDNDDTNGFGAALAVIIAASHLFREPYERFSEAYTCNAFDWSEKVVVASPKCPVSPTIGSIYAVGLGSVGTAALYYLTLATRDFQPTLIDHDRVKIHNLSRSPTFSAADCGRYKVDVTATYLRAAGVEEVIVDAVALDKSEIWRDRAQGTPDIVISAANEFNVRYHIEMGYPPVQIYATTGQNWQTTLLRHLPSASACSLCLFPPDCESRRQTGQQNRSDDLTVAE